MMPSNQETLGILHQVGLRPRAQGLQLLMQHCQNAGLVYCRSVCDACGASESKHACACGRASVARQRSAGERPPACLAAMPGWGLECSRLPAVSCRMGPAMQRMCKDKSRTGKPRGYLGSRAHSRHPLAY